ncbi:MAG: DUF2652 domain-containing protein [Ginsengibacter sp.]
MKGLIFIPDISGFTNFVKSTDINLGVSITRDMLNNIIDNNPLEMNLSEIEGDAVLFYKIGQPLPLKEIINGFTNMYEAFNNLFKKWKSQYYIEADLSLKLIVHYGDIIVYDIKGFKKLYGETVIESHNLLKNGNGISDYILITEDYVRALRQNVSELLFADNEYITSQSQFYSGIKRITYYFFSTVKKTSVLPGMIMRKIICNTKGNKIANAYREKTYGYKTRLKEFSTFAFKSATLHGTVWHESRSSSRAGCGKLRPGMAN